MHDGARAPIWGQRGEASSFSSTPPAALHHYSIISWPPSLAPLPPPLPTSVFHLHPLDAHRTCAALPHLRATSSSPPSLASRLKRHGSSLHPSTTAHSHLPTLIRLHALPSRASSVARSARAEARPRQRRFGHLFNPAWPHPPPRRVHYYNDVVLLLEQREGSAPPSPSPSCRCQPSRRLP